MPPTDPRNDDGDAQKGAVFAALAVGVAAAPFVTGAKTGWLVLSLGVAMALGVTAIMITSGKSYGGQAPLRRG